MHSLYLITNTEKNKSYIGVSQDAPSRINCHLAGQGSRLIKETLGVKFVSKILVYGERNYIYSLESLAIKTYGTLYPQGYNLGLGGEGGNISDRSGENNTCAVLTEALVLQIRKEAKEGKETHQELSEKYFVTRETISTLVRGDSWSHVKGPRSRRKLVSSEDVKLMQELYAKGHSRASISKQTGWSYQTVYKRTK